MPKTLEFQPIIESLPQAEDCRTAPDVITLLRATVAKQGQPERSLCKKFLLNRATGQVESVPFSAGMFFGAASYRLDGIEGVHTLLRELETRHDACVVRGALTAKLKKPVRIRRRKGKELDPVARSWLLCDLDGVPRPPNLPLPATPAETAHALRDLLVAAAPELRDVSCVVRLSASAGLWDLAHAEADSEGRSRWSAVAKNGLSGHVWVWLGTPREEAELRRWVAGVNAELGWKILDAAVVGTVQPIWTAAPRFDEGLPDPLSGARTHYLPGAHPAADLVIPPEPPPRPRRPRSEVGTSEKTGSAQPRIRTTDKTETETARGFDERLARIGPDGFHPAIVSCVGAWVAQYGLDADTADLKARLRAQIDVADRGTRTLAYVAAYQTDSYLDGLISWTRERERQRRHARRALRDRAAIEPAYPARPVPLAEAQRILAAGLERYADAVAAGRRTCLMVRASTGVGKTASVEAMLPRLLAVAHRGGWTGAVVIAVPRHDLGDEIAKEIGHMHPTLRVRQWRGMAAPDPDTRGARMCRWPDLPRAALDAGLPAITPCRTCEVRPSCSYHGQQRGEADVLILAHQALFRPLPEGLPPACQVITDEAWWSAGLVGLDQDTQYALPPDALAADEVGFLDEVRAARLLKLRARLAASIARLGPGQRLTRIALEAEGLTARALQELADLELEAAPPVPELPADALAAQHLLQSLTGHREAHQRAILARLAGALLAGRDPYSEGVRMTLVTRRGTAGRGASEPAIKLAWREDLAGWVQRAPLLILDATTHPDVVQPWLGGTELQVLDVEAEMPHARVRQVVGLEWSRRYLTTRPQAIPDLAKFVVVELARAQGDVLVVLQAAAEQRLRDEVQALCGGTWPERLHVAHHGAITGTNAYRNAERVVVVGRPAPSVAHAERIAALLRSGLGDAPRLAQDEDALWPTRAAGIRLRSGDGLEVRQPTHPDPLVDAVRASVSEGAVLQAAGRLRSVQRRDPTAITLLVELALQTTVDEVVHWEVARPDRLILAAAQAALAGRPLLLSPEGLHACRSDLWGTVTAARRDLEERSRGNKTPPALLLMDLLQAVGGSFPMQAVEYRLATSRGPWSRALVPTGVDPLTALQTLREDVVAVRLLRVAAPVTRPSLTLVETHAAPATPVTPTASLDLGAA